MKVHAALKTTVLALALSTLAVVGFSTQAQCQFSVNLFVTGTNDAIRLGLAQDWCMHVEPVGTQFSASDIDFISVRLISNGTGSVSQIPCRTDKTIIISDANSNGVQDAELCFTKANLAQLFSNFRGKKPKTVTLLLTGNLITGGAFSGTLTIQVYP